jgi:3-deoxy-manno-octulosonate cytidylyltransferase (CMP-KDO synthetase)
MLLRETGKTLLQHTYEAAIEARKPRDVIIAVDHPELADEVKRFGGRAILTSTSCASGTDRVAEAARSLPNAQIIVNLQGDEPEMDPRAIDRTIELLEENPAAQMSTAATPLDSPEQLANPACVKVVFDDAGRALYFSRSPIPFVREPSDEDFTRTPPLYYLHLGLYAYRPEFLHRLAATPPSQLELAERLEQLRVLQMGQSILVGIVDHASQGIDTPADYEQFVTRRLAG